MYSAASGWLMTDLDPDPFIVSLVQVATTLPLFLFALPNWGPIVLWQLERSAQPYTRSLKL
jgi:hypothetical protein